MLDLEREYLELVGSRAWGLVAGDLRSLWGPLHQGASPNPKKTMEHFAT